MSCAASGVIRSPQTATGMAGGQLTAASAQTLPALSDAALAGDVSLRGAFYRALVPLLQSGDKRVRRTAAKALRAGLAALDGREAEL